MFFSKKKKNKKDGVAQDVKKAGKEESVMPMSGTIDVSKSDPTKTSNFKEKSIKNHSSHNLSNPEILEVNLVKDEIVVFFDWNKHLLVALLVFVFAGLFVFEVYAGLNHWEKRESAKSVIIEDETRVLKQEIINLTKQSQDALSFKDKSAAFSDILDNHIYWTRFLSWLESNTINTVKYSGFDGDLSGSYSLSATAPSYAEAAWQAKVFEDDPNVKSVRIDDVYSEVLVPGDGSTLNSLEAGSVSFVISFEVNPDIFKKK